MTYAVLAVGANDREDREPTRERWAPQGKEEPNMMMLQARARRPVVLAMAFALLWSVLAAAFLAPSASAGEPVVSDLVIRSITIDPQTKLATAKGAVTCTDAKRAGLYVEVSQTVGRFHTVYAYAEKRLECDGRERFSLTLTNAQGRLGPGEAQVRAFAGACTREACDFARFSEVIRVTTAN